MHPASEIRSYKLHPSNFHWSPITQIIVVVFLFFISSLSGAHVLQKSQCELPGWETEIFELIKNTQTASLKSLGKSQKKQVEESNRTWHSPLCPFTVCSLSTNAQYSLHTSNNSSQAAPAGSSFFFYFINIPLSCRPGCLIHKNKLGIAFATGVENTPREFTEHRRGTAS